MAQIIGRSEDTPSTIARVDDLAEPGGPGLEERGEHPDDEVERAAAEVAHEVERRPAGGPPARPMARRAPVTAM